MGWLLAIAAVVLWLGAALVWSRGRRPARKASGSPYSPMSARSTPTNDYTTGAAAAPFFLGGSGDGGGSGGGDGGGGGSC